MTRTEHLLVIVAEECNEVAQRVTKALRFGLAEIEPGQELTNAQRIMQEVNDFIAVYQMLAGPVASPTSPLFIGSPDDFMAEIVAKQQKVEKYLAYSQECGTLTPTRWFDLVPTAETAMGPFLTSLRAQFPGIIGRKSLRISAEERTAALELFLITHHVVFREVDQ